MSLDTIFQCWLLFPIVFSLEGFKGNLVQMFTFSDLESETALSISVQLAFKRSAAEKCINMEEHHWENQLVHLFKLIAGGFPFIDLQ